MDRTGDSGRARGRTYRDGGADDVAGNRTDHRPGHRGLCTPDGELPRVWTESSVRRGSRGRLSTSHPVDEADRPVDLPRKRSPAFAALDPPSNAAVTFQPWHP